MTDLPYVAAAYLAVVVALGGYAAHLGRRIARARRRRALMDGSARVSQVAGSDVADRVRS